MVNSIDVCKSKGVAPLVGTAGSEGARRATGEPAVPTNRIETQVEPSSKRRRLTTSYKLKVLQKVSRLREGHSGQIGAYLRSEGLYYATVSKWEGQLENGTLSNKRGPKQSVPNAHTKEKKALKLKVAQLEKKLEKANMLLELQKKISELMGLQQASLNE